MNVNIIYRLLPETLQLLISQKAVRIDRSQKGGMQLTEGEKIFNLKVADTAINISTFLVQERRDYKKE